MGETTLVMYNQFLMIFYFYLNTNLKENIPLDF